MVSATQAIKKTFNDFELLALQPFHSDFRKQVQQTLEEKSINSDSYSPVLALKSIARSVRGLRQKVTETSGKLNASISTLLDPVSRYTGTAIAFADGIAEDPIGAALQLPKALEYSMRKVAPSLVDEMTNITQKLYLDKFIELPGILIGSVRQILDSLEKIIAYPINFVSDMYHGLLGIFEEIQSLISDLIYSIREFAMNILDSLFPGLQDFLSDLSELLGEINELMVITGMTMDSKVDSIINQIASFSSLPNLPFRVDSFFSLSNLPFKDEKNIASNIFQIIDYLKRFRNGLGYNGNSGAIFATLIKNFFGQSVVAEILEGSLTQKRFLQPLLGFSSESFRYRKSYRESDIIKYKKINGKEYLIDSTGNVLPLIERTRRLPLRGEQNLLVFA